MWKQKKGKAGKWLCPLVVKYCNLFPKSCLNIIFQNLRPGEPIVSALNGVNSLGTIVVGNTELVKFFGKANGSSVFVCLVAVVFDINIIQ